MTHLTVQIEQTAVNVRRSETRATTHSVSGTWPKIQFRTLSTSDVQTIPSREMWLWVNPAAMESLDRGLEELRDGKGVSLGSFAAYADDDIE